MNFAAANPGSWRSVAAYAAAPVFLAIITDRVISVIRRHVLPGDTESAWAWLGHATIHAARLTALVALYLLRTILAPKETATGLRRMVLDAAPVPGPPSASAATANGTDEREDHDGQADDDDRDRGDGARRRVRHQEAGVPVPLPGPPAVRDPGGRRPGRRRARTPGRAAGRHRPDLHRRRAQTHRNHRREATSRSPHPRQASDGPGTWPWPPSSPASPCSPAARCSPASRSGG